MPKNAVFYPVKIYDYTPELKGLSILFNKIYVPAKSIPGRHEDGAKDYRSYPDRDEAKMYDYLEDKGVIVTYENFTTKEKDHLLLNDPVFPDHATDKIREEWIRDIPGTYDNLDVDNQLQATYKFNDVFARIDALELAKRNDAEFYPLSNLSIHSKGRVRGQKLFVLFWVIYHALIRRCRGKRSVNSGRMLIQRISISH